MTEVLLSLLYIVLFYLIGNKSDVIPACGDATTRIVGGVDATENQLPWQCTFQKSDGSW